MTYYINPDSGGVVRVTGDRATRLADAYFHPAIVLDPEGDGPERMVELIEAYRESIRGGDYTPNFLSHTIWHTVLTEYAKPTPPEPEEPTGYLARVRDGSGHEWHREDRPGYPWVRRDGRDIGHWSHPPRPLTVISQGVDDDE